MRTAFCIIAITAASLGQIPAFSQTSGTASAPATTHAAAPAEVTKLIDDSLVLARAGKWDEIIDTLVPAHVKEKLTAEKRAEVRERMQKDDLFIRSLEAAKTTAPTVAEDSVTYSFGDNKSLKQLHFVKHEGKWYLK